MEALLDSRLGQLLPVELLQKIVEMTPGGACDAPPLCKTVTQDPSSNDPKRSQGISGGTYG